MKKFNKKTKKVILIILSIVLLLIIFFVIYKICTRDVSDNDKGSDNSVKEQFDLNNYNYYLVNNATLYEEELFNDLKDVLSKNDMNEEEYASVLSKIFISNLFTLDTKKSSSDVSSSQYVYTDYQDTYKEIIKDTIYAGIITNLDGKRTQDLPIVSNVEVESISRESFSYQGNVIDTEAYNIKLKIEYERDLGYPTSYKVLLVHNNELLQVAKAGE